MIFDRSKVSELSASVIQVDDPAWNEVLTKLRHDSYHLSDYVALEARRIEAAGEAILVSDRSGERIFFLPYLVRDCSDLSSFIADPDSEIRDVVSPYGYPGYLCSQAAEQHPEFLGAAWQRVMETWKESNICSAFLRLHPLLSTSTDVLNDFSEATNTPTVVVDLAQSVEQIWKDTARKRRAAIRKAERFQVSVRVADYSESLPVFQEIYRETMIRAAANSGYFFAPEYFSELGRLSDSVRLMVAEHKDEIVAATIVLCCDGIVQAHLGGTRTAHLPLSPLSLLLFETLKWAKAEGNRFLHLGGGLGGGNDRLFSYKAGFSPMRWNFTTARFIVDPEAYQVLVQQRAKTLSVTPESLESSGFFPAYRSGLNE